MRITILFVCIYISTNLFSQDYLYKKDGRIILARINQTDHKTTVYNLFTDQEGIVYYISNSMVDSIVFENGRTKRFHNISTIANASFHKNLAYPKHNTLFLDIFDLVYRYNLGFGYDFLLHKPQIGFAFSFSKDFSKKEVQKYDWERVYYPFMHPNYSLKAALHLYFVNLKPLNYGLGIAYRSIQFDKGYDLNTPINGSYWQIKPTIYNSFAFVFFGKYYFNNFFNAAIAMDIHFKNHEGEIFFIPLCIIRLDLGINF